MKAAKLFKGIAAALIWLVLWQVLYMAVNKSVLLASPLQTAKALYELMRTSALWLSAAGSVARVAAGFALGAVFGCALAVLTHVSDFASVVFKPFLTAVKATPVASFIILAFVWLPVTVVPVFTSFLIVLPVFHSSISAAIETTDKKLLEMASAYRMKKSVRLRRIYIPTVMPSFVSCVTAGIGMAWKAGVAAEVICRCRTSLGGGLYSAKISLETDKVFAWTVTVIVLSLILEKAAVALIARIYNRRRRGNA